MNAKDIQELFDLQNVLTQAVGSVDADIVTAPEVLSALLDWKHRDNGKVDVQPTPKAKPAKATAAKAKPEPSPDPSDSDDPGF